MHELRLQDEDDLREQHQDAAAEVAPAACAAAESPSWPLRSARTGASIEASRCAVGCLCLGRGVCHVAAPVLRWSCDETGHDDDAAKA